MIINFNKEGKRGIKFEEKGETKDQKQRKNGACKPGENSIKRCESQERDE